MSSREAVSHWNTVIQIYKMVVAFWRWTYFTEIYWGTVKCSDSPDIVAKNSTDKVIHTVLYRKLQTTNSYCNSMQLISRDRPTKKDSLCLWSFFFPKLRHWACAYEGKWMGEGVVLFLWKKILAKRNKWLIFVK